MFAFVSVGLPWIVSLSAASIAAGFDVRTRRIPNALSLPLLALGLTYSATLAPHGILGGLAGMAIAGGPFVLLWLLGGGGAGDAKMMLAIGSWLGPLPAAVALAAVALIGGALSVAVASRQQRLRSLLGSTVAAAVITASHRSLALADGTSPLTQAVRRGESVPYGVAIALGVAVAWGVLQWLS